MTRLPLFATLFVATITSQAWALEVGAARHLLGRTNFAAKPAEVAALLPLDRAAAVRSILDAAGGIPSLAPPDWTREWIAPQRLRGNIRSAADGISQRLDGAPDFADQFSGSEIGRQMRVAARLIAARVPLAAIKIRQSGYDTHIGQLGAQTHLLGQFAGAMAAFRGAMQQSDLWDRVLVMTYAEFGRRVAESGGAGTDHGTASSHFVMGGRVKGGLHGAQPSLADLDNGNLRYCIDYRRLYAAAVQWWKLPPAPRTLKSHTPLGLLKA